MEYEKKIIELRDGEGNPFVKVSAEISDTQEKRDFGLKFRSDLSESSGMLFVFPREDRYGFWMQDTSLPLDIIFFDSDRKIIDIFKNMTPFSEELRYPARSFLFALEVRGGFCEKYRIGEGGSFMEI